MPMRERRAAHVRPLPPSNERLRAHHLGAPSRDVLSRYRPVRSPGRVSQPLGFGTTVLFLCMAAVVLIAGGNILAAVAGQVAHAFDDAAMRISSLPPATPPPSGVALDTPTLDPPNNDGYTNQATVSLTGGIPGAATNKPGYRVRIYSIDPEGKRTIVAEVPVGATTHFATAAIKLSEGTNTFVASLVTPSSEGQASPPVAYVLDTTPPKLIISAPLDGSTQSGSSVVVSGRCDPGSTVTIRNRQSPGGALSSKVVGDDGRFAITIGLVAGTNSINVTSKDQAGNVTTDDVTVNRSYGKLTAHLTASPATFRAAGQTSLKLTVRAATQNGGPMAGASAVFTVQVAGLGAIVSPELTTDQTGTASWTVTISNASAGVGAASVLVTSSDGSQVQATTRITTS